MVRAYRKIRRYGTCALQNAPNVRQRPTDYFKELIAKFHDAYRGHSPRATTSELLLPLHRRKCQGILSACCEAHRTFRPEPPADQHSDEKSSGVRSNGFIIAGSGTAARKVALFKFLK